MPKVRVFVSSVIEGFTAFREAARRAIISLGAEPVMAEDFPASSASPRNACLDGVASSDVYLLIVGSRGGWRTPSGQLAVEEEYEEAKRRNKILSLYVQDVGRDADAERLERKVSDYVGGHFRARFADSSELERVIQEKLSPILSQLRLPLMNTAQLEEKLNDSYRVEHETTLRLVLAPERSEEVIDRVDIGSTTFVERILRVGHDSRVFDYRNAKTDDLKRDTLAIEQKPRDRHPSADPDRRIEITPTGLVTIDAIVSPQEQDARSFGTAEMFFLVRGDVERALIGALTFGARLYNDIDPHLRHQRFYYGVSFTNVGFRSLADQVETRSSYSMARNIEETLVIEKTRVISRNVLNDPQNEVNRIVTLLRRAIEAEG